MPKTLIAQIRQPISPLPSGLPSAKAFDRSARCKFAPPGETRGFLMSHTPQWLCFRRPLKAVPRWPVAAASPITAQDRESGQNKHHAKPAACYNAGRQRGRQPQSAGTPHSTTPQKCRCGDILTAISRQSVKSSGRNTYDVKNEDAFFVSVNGKPIPVNSRGPRPDFPSPLARL